MSKVRLKPCVLLEQVNRDVISPNDAEKNSIVKYL